MASKTIGRLKVDLVANSAGFSAGMDHARKRTSSFGKEIAAVKSQLLGFGAALAGAVSVRAIAGMVSGQIEAIDATAKLADRLNMSTEALLGFRHAAGLSGVSTDELDGALSKMQIRLGEAVADGGEAADAFTALGLSAKQLMLMAPDAAFARIADAVNLLPTAASRASAAVEIFGKTGAALLPLLAAGSAGLAGMAAETDKLGTSFSRLDAAKVEAANDAIGRAGAALTGIKQTLTIELAPAITALVTAGTDWLAGVTTGANTAAGALGGVANKLQIIGDTIDTITGITGAVKGNKLAAFAPFTPMGMAGLPKLGRDIYSGIFGPNAPNTGADLRRRAEEASAAASEVAAGSLLRQFFAPLDALQSELDRGRAAALAEQKTLDALDAFFGPIDAAANEAAVRRQAADRAARLLGLDVSGPGTTRTTGAALLSDMAPVSLGEPARFTNANAPITVGSMADVDLMSRVASAGAGRDKYEAIQEQSLAVLREINENTLATKERLELIGEQEGLTVR